MTLLLGFVTVLSTIYLVVIQALETKEQRRVHKEYLDRRRELREKRYQQEEEETVIDRYHSW